MTFKLSLLPQALWGAGSQLSSRGGILWWSYYLLYHPSFQKQQVTLI